MSEKESPTIEQPQTDESGRVRTPMSPATWTADEQPGVVQTEPSTKDEAKPSTKDEAKPKKAG